MGICIEGDKELMYGRCQGYLGKEVGSLGNCEYVNRKFFRRKKIVFIKYFIFEEKENFSVVIMGRQGCLGFGQEGGCVNFYREKVQFLDCQGRRFLRGLDFKYYDRIQKIMEDWQLEGYI